ncbi:MAG: hypothetical protein WC908_01185 [Candidatus Paceibacterota bacterium]
MPQKSTNKKRIKYPPIDLNKSTKIEKLFEKAQKRNEQSERNRKVDPKFRFEAEV